MTQLDYRANLSAAIFPMTVAKASRSVIIPGPDNNFDRRVDAPGDNQRGSVGIPQIIFGQNILPTPDGYQSVGFKPSSPSIDIDATELTEVLPIRIATAVVTTEVTVGGEILYSGEGDDLASWESSPDNVPPNAISEVTQEATGGNPDDCFSLTSVITGAISTGYMPAYPWVRRAFSVGNPDNAAFNVDVNYTASHPADFAGEKVVIGIFNSSGNNGLKVILDYDANTIAFGPGTDIYGAGFVATDSATPSGTLTRGDWYTVQCVLTKVSADPADQNRAVTITLIDDTATTIATLTGFYAVALISYCSVAYITDTAEGTPISDDRDFELLVDNTEVTGDGEETTTEYTEYTGLTTVYVAFRDDDTANWSYGLDSWDNNTVTVPGSFESPASRNKISVAIVRGVTYICIRKADNTTVFYTAAVDTGTDVITLTDITTTINDSLPAGTAIDSILGICSSYNYLILFTGGTILWSSTTTPTDFAPSLVSGAGNEVPGNLKGDITFLREHVSGFFIYSTNNVVFAQYTGNARYPWRFREVGQSGGFTYSTQVSGDTNSSIQYGVNNSKFVQVLNPETAELVAPEVTDFIERVKRWDILDTDTFVFSLSDATDELIPADKPTTWFVLDRYLLLPYGDSGDVAGNQWTYVIVYDLLLKRYGKLFIAFDFCLTDEKNVFFISRLTGDIYKLYFDIHEYNVPPSEGDEYIHEGVIVLGKFQLTRDRFICLDELTIDAIQNIDELADPDDRAIEVRVLPSLDGRSFEAPVEPYDNTDTSQNVDGLQLLARVSCQNFALAFVGAFDLNTVAMTFHPEGDK